MTEGRARLLGALALGGVIGLVYDFLTSASAAVAYLLGFLTAVVLIYLGWIVIVFLDD